MPKGRGFTAHLVMKKMMLTLVSEKAETRAFLYADSFDAYLTLTNNPFTQQTKAGSYHKLPA